MDAKGAAALTVFALVLAFNQVVVKVSIQGFQPAFMAGLRSLAALFVVLLWMRARRLRIDFQPGVWLAGIGIGLLFSAEFLLLYLSLEWTTVSRASIIFYSMPVHLSLAAHFLIPGERLNAVRGFGLLLAMAGVGWVLFDPAAGDHTIWGDLAALGAAITWAGIALFVRVTPLAKVQSETQLLWQLGVSTVALLLVAPLFGPLLRDLQPIHIAGLVFQTIVVASMGYLFWLMVMKIYPASGVASFSFLSPVFGVALGWLMLGEQVDPEVIGGLILVAVGLILINVKRA